MKITSVIDSTSANVRVVIENDGTEVTKTVTFKQYREACSAIGEYATAIPRVGRLPQGFYDGGASDGSYEAIIKVPAGKRPFFYFGKEYCIPFPELVFHFHQSAGEGRKTKVWAADEKGKLYRYPFGNVYNDAKICWGRNVVPKVECLKDFDQLVALFFSASTNDDMYHPIHTVIDGKEVSLRQRDLVEVLSKMDAFPTEWLHPFGLHIDKL